MKKVLCSNSETPRVFAHILDDGTIDVVRQDQRFTILGESFTLIGTNPQGNGKTVLQVVDGKLLEDDIEFKVEEPITPPEEDEVKPPEGDEDEKAS